ncbi:hypothetical protein PR048_012279 [Dryococelus australis]|uniref:HAT C-terminal dimerisation domain-containing protein n=1 Tax=Dryococelus australis TaxID=614101 RepID=A0ABQ9HQ77_9NEOP|nr:hypothetical protein PR048_012279 [Dryococelus australis]
MKNHTLECSHFPGQHTGSAICLQNFPIYVVSDNARNMSSALTGKPVEHLSCIAVSDVVAEVGLDSFLKTCTSIIGHYKHSTKSRERLPSLQKKTECIIALSDSDEAVSADLPNCGKECLTEQERNLSAGYVTIFQPLFLAAKELWRENLLTLSMIWPVIELAMHYLSIPTNSAASERLFSKAGLAISTQHQNLSSSLAEKLVLLHDNLDEDGFEKSTALVGKDATSNSYTNQQHSDLTTIVPVRRSSFAFLDPCFGLLLKESPLGIKSCVTERSCLSIIESDFAALVLSGDKQIVRNGRKPVLTLLEESDNVEGGDNKMVKWMDLKSSTEESEYSSDVITTSGFRSLVRSSLSKEKSSEKLSTLDVPMPIASSSVYVVCCDKAISWVSYHVSLPLEDDCAQYGQCVVHPRMLGDDLEGGVVAINCPGMLREVERLSVVSSLALTSFLSLLSQPPFSYV